MTAVRVYVPTTSTGLRALVTSGRVGEPPLRAHAVTESLRSADPDGGEEEWEYAALTAAAQDSVRLLRDDDEPRRAVLVAEVRSVAPRSAPAAGSEDLTAVDVTSDLALADVVACHVDSDDATGDVRAARAGHAAVERCLRHELGWFATQEIAHLVAG